MRFERLAAPVIAVGLVLGMSACKSQEGDAKPDSKPSASVKAPRGIEPGPELKNAVQNSSMFLKVYFTDHKSYEDVTLDSVRKDTKSAYASNITVADFVPSSDGKSYVMTFRHSTFPDGKNVVAYDSKSQSIAWSKDDKVVIGEAKTPQDLKVATTAFAGFLKKEAAKNDGKYPTGMPEEIRMMYMTNGEQALPYDVGIVQYKLFNNNTDVLFTLLGSKIPEGTKGEIASYDTRNH